MLNKIKQNYKWVILVVCFMMELVCLGFCSSNAGMYLTAITKALGYERSLFSLNTSFRYIVSFVVSLSFGTLIQKFGTKKLVFTGLVCLILSTGIRIFASELYQFYLSGAFLGAGVILVGSTMTGHIIRQWFDHDVGKYTGIALAANGIGGAIAAQIISPLINNGDPFGYRGAYTVATIIVIVISVIIMVCLKDPEGKEVTFVKKKKVTANWEGLEYKQLLKKPYFYLTAILIFFNGICLESISHSGISHLLDTGIDSQFVANVSTAASLILTVAKILIGIVYDKKGLRFTLIACRAVMIVSLVLIIFAGPTPFGKFAALAALVLSRLALPIETVMLPLLSADMFGSKAMASVPGVFVAAKSAGSCVDSPLCNLVYDLTGSYIPVYIFFSIMMIVVAFALQLVINLAYKEKAKLIAPQAQK